MDVEQPQQPMQPDGAPDAAPDAAPDDAPDDAPDAAPDAAPAKRPRRPHYTIPPLPPRVGQPGVLPFKCWYDKHAYFVDCIVTCIKTRMGAPTEHVLTWDWDAIHTALAHFMYHTSANRFRRFTMLK